MEKFGLGYEAVKAIKPDIIYIAMSMQGVAGPEHKYLGYGLTMGALTGLQFLSGLPEREPAGTGTNFSDHIPNPCHAAFAILAALRHRRRTGVGQYIDVAQTEPTIALLGPAMSDCSANNRIPERSGNERAPRAPHGVFRCRGLDRWIAISAWQDETWSALCRVLGDPPFARAPQLATAHGRWENRDTIDEGISAITCHWDAEDLMSALQFAGIPAGVVRTAADIVDDDPQLRHRGHWVKLVHPEMGESVYNAPPFRIHDAPVTPVAPAPMLGQHTDEVLTTILGLGAAELETLRRQDVLT
jgi:benzylsuccinate CoA-transferase BbsF subunit